MISKATLPPKLGYVEVENSGERVHKKVETETDKENSLLSAQLQAQTERSDFIEDCIAEMATQVYAE